REDSGSCNRCGESSLQPCLRISRRSGLLVHRTPPRRSHATRTYTPQSPVSICLNLTHLHPRDRPSRMWKDTDPERTICTSAKKPTCIFSPRPRTTSRSATALDISLSPARDIRHQLTMPPHPLI
ncbi:hypothetical protein CORC01_12046, partial [Colletotrichum orchidophilum]